MREVQCATVGEQGCVLQMVRADKGCVLRWFKRLGCIVRQSIMGAYMTCFWAWFTSGRWKTILSVAYHSLLHGRHCNGDCAIIQAGHDSCMDKVTGPPTFNHFLSWILAMVHESCSHSTSFRTTHVPIKVPSFTFLFILQYKPLGPRFVRHLASLGLYRSLDQIPRRQTTWDYSPRSDRRRPQAR